MAATIALTAGCAAAGGESRDASVTLVFADHFSKTNPMGRGGVTPFLDHIKEHGPAVGLDVNYFGPGQLGKRTDGPTLLRTGAVDITPVTPATSVDKVPLSTVADLPGMVSDSCEAASAILPMVQPGGTLYETELKQQGIHVLWSISVADYEIYTTDKRVARPSDLEGSLIRTPGGVADRTLAGLGAAPAQITVTDLYEALARRTVSGANLPQYSVPTYSLHEELNFGTQGAQIGANAMHVAISPMTWGKLNPEQRRVIEDASAIAQGGVCREVAEESEKAAEVMREAGVELTQIAGTDRAEWDRALEPIRQQWVKDLESRGLPAREVLAEAENRLGVNG